MGDGSFIYANGEGGNKKTIPINGLINKDLSDRYFISGLIFVVYLWKEVLC